MIFHLTVGGLKQKKQKKELDIFWRKKNCISKISISFNVHNNSIKLKT